MIDIATEVVELRSQVQRQKEQINLLINAVKELTGVVRCLDNVDFNDSSLGEVMSCIWQAEDN